jgi:hypothetical protein
VDEQQVGAMLPMDLEVEERIAAHKLNRVYRSRRLSEIARRAPQSECLRTCLTAYPYGSAPGTEFGYAPLKRALRFSRNAAMPSRASG